MYVFICAAGHSGSTLLDILLGSHPAGVSLGEITQLPKNIALDSRCSCGNAVSDCEFWKPLVTAYGEKLGVDVWSDPYALDFGFIMAGTEIDPRHQTRAALLRRRLSYAVQFLSFRYRLPGAAWSRRHSVAAARRKAGLFELIRWTTGRTFVVDSSKHYLEAMNLYTAAPDETRTILLLRDGRAVFYSGLHRGLSPARALGAWADTWKRARPVIEENIPAGRVIHVKYEDLVANTDRELERIFRFLGVDPARYTGPTGVADRHIVNGNRMRFTDDLVVRADEKWRTELDQKMLDYFERRAGKLNRALGYETAS